MIHYDVPLCIAADLALYETGTFEQQKLGAHQQTSFATSALQ